MQKRIDSSGPNGAWVPSNTKPTFQNKKLSQRAIKKELIAWLRDEIAILEHLIKLTLFKAQALESCALILASVGGGVYERS